jgi:hypothetical protein
LNDVTVLSWLPAGGNLAERLVKQTVRRLPTSCISGVSPSDHDERKSRRILGKLSDQREKAVSNLI